MIHATEEQVSEVITDLVAFIHRVAMDKNASPAELTALPEAAKVILRLGPLSV